MILATEECCNTSCGFNEREFVHFVPRLFAGLGKKKKTRCWQCWSFCPFSSNTLTENSLLNTRCVHIYSLTSETASHLHATGQWFTQTSSGHTADRHCIFVYSCFSLLIYLKVNNVSDMRWRSALWCEEPGKKHHLLQIAARPFHVWPEKKSAGAGIELTATALVGVTLLLCETLSSVSETFFRLSIIILNIDEINKRNIQWGSKF